MKNYQRYSQSTLPYKKYKLKICKSKPNISNLKNELIPQVNFNKRNRASNNFYYNKRFIFKNIFSLLSNTQTNNSISNNNSSINSKTNSKISSTNENNKANNNIYINTPIKLKNNTKKYSFKINNNKFILDQTTVKPLGEFKYQNKSKSMQYFKKEGIFSKTENNQKYIINNLGIHYHKVENNNLKDKIKELNYKREIRKLKNKINILLEKHKNVENQKKEKDKKIEILEEKVDNLMNFIKNNNILILKDKNIKLQNYIDDLKLENEKLKKEINKKNKIFEYLYNFKINKSIGKKKEKNIIKNYTNSNISITISNNNKTNDLNEIDIQKIKLISIDPNNI